MYDRYTGTFAGSSIGCWRSATTTSYTSSSSSIYKTPTRICHFLELEELMSDEKYRSMSEDELEKVINYNLSGTSFNKLPGKFARDKAQKLMEVWQLESKSPTIMPEEPMLKINLRKKK